MRNVEHVCDEVRKHLLHLAKLAGESQVVVHQLQDRTSHLQEHVEDSAEALLRQVSFVHSHLHWHCHLGLKWRKSLRIDTANGNKVEEKVEKKNVIVE